MDINELVGIGAVGAVLSLLVEWIKSKYGPSSGQTKALTLVLAFIVGGLYVWLRQTTAWVTIIGVLGASSTVYALFFK